MSHTEDGGPAALSAHLAWSDKASSTDMGDHLLAGHALIIGGNADFKKRVHYVEHAGIHGKLI